MSRAPRFASLFILLSSPSSPLSVWQPRDAKKRLLEAGNKYFKENKFKEASIIYRKALQKDARYGEAYYRLGLSELRLGRYGEALRAFERASELQPENEDASSRLGDLYLSIYLSDRTRFKQLLTDFSELSDRMLKRNPKSFAGLRMKGYQLVAENKVAEATGFFEKALAAKPDDTTVMLAYVQALYGAGDKGKSITLAREFLGKNKKLRPPLRLPVSERPGAEEHPRGRVHPQGQARKQPQSRRLLHRACRPLPASAKGRRR
ncbi:MAG: tetratricopeptide repeat protein [Bryobacterales bacterium]|nr:tetratricopeptide repeat protein [Bryobacterales bacterium]